MSRIDLIALAHRAVSEVSCEGDSVIDATLGNGHDALFLARCVGKSGHLYGFDIQPAALAATEQRLAHHGVLQRATLIHAGHETMARHIPPDEHGHIQAVMFNLGYLPGNDHTVRTHGDTTRHALQSAHTLLAADGIIVIVAYTGHPHGRAETETVKAWAHEMERAGDSVELTIPPSRHGNAPELVVIRRTGTTDR